MSRKSFGFYARHDLQMQHMGSYTWNVEYFCEILSSPRPNKFDLFEIIPG